jgi:hypothetical protein
MEQPNRFQKLVAEAKKNIKEISLTTPLWNWAAAPRP